MPITRAYLERVETFEAWATKVRLPITRLGECEGLVSYLEAVTEYAFRGFMQGLSIGLSDKAAFDAPIEVQSEESFWWVRMDGMKRRGILYRVLGVAWYDAFHTAWGDLTPRIQEAIREIVKDEHHG